MASTPIPGVDFSSSTEAEYDAWWLSEKLTDRLTNLIKLELTCVGANGLDYWVSKEDIKCLVEWAEGFNMTEKF